jgi:hypothetical protein
MKYLVFHIILIASLNASCQGVPDKSFDSNICDRIYHLAYIVDSLEQENILIFDSLKCIELVDKLHKYFSIRASGVQESCSHVAWYLLYVEETSFEIRIFTKNKFHFDYINMSDREYESLYEQDFVDYVVVYKNRDFFSSLLKLNYNNLLKKYEII